MIGMKRTANTSGSNGELTPVLRDQIKVNVHRKLIETVDLLEAQHIPADQLRNECSQQVEKLLRDQKYPLSSSENKRLIGEILDEIFGLGPLEELLRDPSIGDILVNSAQWVYVERHGKLELTDISFRDNGHLLKVIQRIAARVGRRIDESSPMLDARLSDGSRINAIIPPLAIDGPMMSVRRFGAEPITAQRLVELESAAPDIVTFLEACVRSRVNMLVSGGTGSGKTTLLNVLSKWIPEDERAVTIEDAAELQLQKKHVVRLETRAPNIEGKGQVTQRDLLRNALRMRPDRIIIGEVRGTEALDMLQAMNTGHEGSMTSIHANSPRDALGRIENMVSMTGLNFPVHVVRQQMSSSINLLIHVGRLTGGRRKILNISEVAGMESATVLIQDLFRYRQVGVGKDGHAEGYFEACGVYPRVLERIKAEGIMMPEDLFRRRKLRMGNYPE